jgi:hypothetical protein
MLKNHKAVGATVLALGLSWSNAGLALNYDGHMIVGVEAGQAARSGKFNGSYQAGTGLGIAPRTPLGSHVEKISDQGIRYGLLGGYEWHYPTWLVGVEGNISTSDHFSGAAHYNFKDSAGQNLNFDSAARYYRGTLYGISSRLGLKIPPFFTPYARLGAEVSRDRMQRNHKVSGAETFNDYFAARKTSARWLVGGGVEVPFFAKHSSLRAEYNYIGATKFHFHDQHGSLHAKHDYRPRTHLGKITWVWHFH